ncbi:MAG: VWA domain-containing protein [Candidatus Heimdallarchaeota archaeon]|nr:VWA domain-containing protein [Candidatus Heimdallarchaeota archaeon]
MTHGMKFSTGDKIPASEKLLDNIPLVGELSFNDFEDTKPDIKGKPIICSNCGAIITDIHTIQTDVKIGTFFNCLFCGSLNVIDPNDLPTNINAYVGWLIPPSSIKPAFGEGIQKGNSLIAALDISGSMAGAKLEGVKQSLISTVTAYSKSKADAIFGVVAFESNLYIYSPEGEVIETVSGDALYDIKEIERKIADNSWIRKQLAKMTIGTTAKNWQKTIQKMRDMNSTALGPAVVAARIMSLAAGTGRILLLTDGMANVGVGNLSGASPEGKRFYQMIAEELKKNGIVLDIVGIAGEGSLELKSLAQMPEITGGDLFYVDLSELQDSFSLISGDEIIGRNARIKVIVPKEIELSNLSGAGARADKIKSGEDISLGGLTKSRSISFEFKPKKEVKNLEKVPVQVQVRYKDENDNERIRVIEKELAVSEIKEELEKSLDADLIAGYTVQRAAQVMQEDRKKSKEMMKDIQSKLAKVAPKAAEAQTYLKSELEELDNVMDEEASGASRADDRIQANAYRMVKKRKI